MRGLTMMNEKKTISFDLRKYMMVIALVGIWVIFGAISGGTYLLPRNMSNLFRQSVFTAILAIGMLNVIVLGQIDLSVGSIAGLCGGILAIANVWKGMSPLVSILITLAAGLLLGLWNGWWIAYRNVPSFIVTMAGLLVFRGVLVGITDGITIGPVSPFFGVIGKEFLPSLVGIVLGAVVIVVYLVMQYSERSGKARHGLRVAAPRNEILKSVFFTLLIVVFVFVMNTYRGVPNPVVIVLVLFVLFAYVSNRTVFGRRVYAIGGNKMASRLSGIDIKKITLIVFGINGAMAAIAAIFLTSRLDAAAVNAATSAELDAIAACVIGGTSLMGGVGTVFGAIIGAVVMASLDNGMSLLNAPSFYQTIVKGLVLLLAVWFDMSRKQGERS
jgi:D-xylose transport system permease protein